MTQRVFLIVGALALVGILVLTAFGGGLFIGRVTALRGIQPAACPPPSLSQEPIAEKTQAIPEEQYGMQEMQLSEDFDYKTLESVLNLLDEQFYGEIPDGKTLAYGAIRGMLLTLDDPYTSFIDPEITAVLNEDASGSFEGIGAMVTMRADGYLEVASLMPGQPAEAAGVLPGDIILAVGDQSLVGLGLYEAISYIRGPAGTEAVLEIARSGEPESLIITVVRASIEIQVVESKMLEDGIAYVALAEFDASATEKLQEALKELLAQKPKALVFDLRGNPGGWLDQAIKVSDLFLDKGLVAIERDSSGGEQKFYSYDGDLGEDIPMVILVDRGSASASEIVAGAMQDRGRAILIGQKTLGKGSVQRPNDLEDGSQLRITIARWFTPNDQSIHGEGLTPDVEQDFPTDTPTGEDPQLDRAIEYLLNAQGITP
ncbi:MAG TPA: S41 family peptidase [Anaerolineae bacterium]|nr:S41 family peptidase [Anaerolineae bacterium]